MAHDDPRWELIVADDWPAGDALARTTDLAVVAHPDDLELLLPGPILDCARSEQRWFTGVVVTDGAGSLGTDQAPTGSAELVALRAAEQRAAVGVGGHSVVMLGVPSSSLTDPVAAREVFETVRELVLAARADTVYTHAPTDKHATHVAVGALTIGAACSLAPPQRPAQLLGVEGWRDLDWLDEQDKVFLAVEDAERALELAAVFTSQLVHKRYDLAAQGRRRANATFAAPRSADDHVEVSVAMDLTPLLSRAEPDVIAHVHEVTSRFARDAERAVAQAVAVTTDPEPSDPVEEVP